MARIILKQTVLEHEPLAIRRPRRPEIKVIRMRCHQLSISTFSVAGPNLVALRAGEMKGDSLVIRADTETVGQTFARPGEWPHITAIEIHAERLAEFASRHLHQNPSIAHQRLGGIENLLPIF